MPDLTVSTAVDSIMQASGISEIFSALGIFFSFGGLDGTISSGGVATFNIEVDGALENGCVAYSLTQQLPNFASISFEVMDGNVVVNINNNTQDGETTVTLAGGINLIVINQPTS